MAKKEAIITGGSTSLIKDCGKLIVISTMIVLILGLGILTWKKKDKLTIGKKSSTVTKETVTTQKSDPQLKWELKDEIKKLESRQQHNMSSRRSSNGDPLAD